MALVLWGPRAGASSLGSLALRTSQHEEKGEDNLEKERSLSLTRAASTARAASSSERRAGCAPATLRKEREGKRVLAGSY